MKRYRGFAGQVPLMGFPRTDLTPEQAARFPNAMTFCGREDFDKYYAQYGAAPAGSHILDQPYAAGPGSECYDYLTAQGQTYQAPVVVTPPPAVPLQVSPSIDVDEAVQNIAPTISAEELQRLKRRLKRAKERALQQQELEAKQYAEGGDGYAPVLEQQAATDVAARDVIESGAPPVNTEGPNWIPLFLAAAAIFIMNT